MFTEPAVKERTFWAQGYVPSTFGFKKGEGLTSIRKKGDVWVSNVSNIGELRKGKRTHQISQGGCFAHRAEQGGGKSLVKRQYEEGRELGGVKRASRALHESKNPGRKRRVPLETSP